MWGTSGPPHKPYFYFLNFDLFAQHHNPTSTDTEFIFFVVLVLILHFNSLIHKSWNKPYEIISKRQLTCVIRMEKTTWHFYKLLFGRTTNERNNFFQFVQLTLDKYYTHSSDLLHPAKIADFFFLFSFHFWIRSWSRGRDY